MPKINLKVQDFHKEKVNIIRGNIDKYRTIGPLMNSLMEHDTEKVYLIIYTKNDLSEAKMINISDGEGDESSVMVDIELFEKLLAYEVSVGNVNYSLAHNHPYMADEDGDGVETLVSTADMATTDNLISKAHPSAVYHGHFIANKEDKADKVIHIEERLKYNDAVINLILGDQI